MVAGQKKPLTSGGGWASYCIVALFQEGGRFGCICHSPSCSSPPSPGAGFLPSTGAVEGGGGVGSQPRNKNHPWNKNRPWQKALSQHKGLPTCQIFKKSLNFTAGTYLEADLQESSGILLRLARLCSG